MGILSLAPTMGTGMSIGTIGTGLANNIGNGIGNAINKGINNIKDNVKIISSVGKEWLRSKLNPFYKPNITVQPKEETTEEKYTNPYDALSAEEQAEIQEYIKNKIDGLNIKDKIKQGIQNLNNRFNNKKENEEEKENKTPIILPTEEQPTKEQPTEEQPTEKSNSLKLAEEWLKKYWEREDKIRAETNEREDNAYQRAVADMRKAGINPNLMNVQPAQSGSGINNATTHNQGLVTTEMTNLTQQAIAELTNAVKQGEGTKDRITDVVTRLASTIGTVLAMYFMKRGG